MIPEYHRVALPPEQVTIPPGHPWNRLPVIGAACALLGAVACAILGAADPKQFFSYRRTTHRAEPDYGRHVNAISLI